MARLRSDERCGDPLHAPRARGRRSCKNRVPRAAVGRRPWERFPGQPAHRQIDPELIGERALAVLEHWRPALGPGGEAFGVVGGGEAGGDAGRAASASRRPAVSSRIVRFMPRTASGREAGEGVGELGDLRRRARPARPGGRGSRRRAAPRRRRSRRGGTCGGSAWRAEPVDGAADAGGLVVDAEPGRRHEGAHAGDADAEVAGEGELDPAAVGAAVEGGDGRRREGLERVAEPGQRVVGPVGGRRRRRARRRRRSSGRAR